MITTLSWAAVSDTAAPIIIVGPTLPILPLTLKGVESSHSGVFTEEQNVQISPLLNVHILFALRHMFVLAGVEKEAA